MNTLAKKRRLAFLDGLRGVAVLLMMEQNIGIWLWRADGPMHFANHQILYSLNGIGGLAGPLFITLAGISSAFFEQRHAAVDRTLVLRGLGIMLCGYLMNAITPGLFSVGSWFTLQMIGFAILTTPLYRRMNNAVVLLLAAAVVVGTGLLHHYLETPLRLSIHHMRTGPPWRLMLAEGYYAIFPWLAFYLAGFTLGRFYLDHKKGRIALLAAIPLAIGGVLLLPIGLDLPCATQLPAALFLRLNLGFFPTPPLFVLLFFPVVAFLFFFFEWIASWVRMHDQHLLVSLGRVSLTLQIVHVFIFHDVSQRLRLFRSFSTAETMGIIVAALLLAALLSIQWQKNAFKFSFEWALRRMAG